MLRNAIFYGLLRRREVVLPSLRGWIVLIALLATGAYALLKCVYPYLSPNRPIHGEVLVVEGWIPDYSQREALAVFRSGGYRLLITTGGALPDGLPYSHFGTHAELAMVILKGMGLGADSVVAVPSEFVFRDRTYMEGVALREWMKANGHNFRSLDLFTFSAHGRRRLYLYQKALGKQVNIGVYSARDLGYDPKMWWKSSNGVRKILDETFAYVYAVTIFRP